ASPTVGASPTPALTYDALLGLSSASAVSSFLPVLPAGSQEPRRLHRPFPISTPAGCTSITDWIKNSAHGWQSHNSGAARVYVSADSSGNEIAGYYSLSSGAVELIEAPARIGQGMPTRVPVQLIGRLGVSQCLKRQGIG